MKITANARLKAFPDMRISQPVTTPPRCFRGELFPFASRQRGGLKQENDNFIQHQGAWGGNVAAVLDSAEAISKDSPKSAAIEIREGDWKAYLNCIARCNDEKSILDRYGSIVAYKRACALAYLGRRAQLHGGVCSNRHPHIMTPQFIADLETGNRANRHARYPWLKALMNLLAEIEQIQDQISGNNVITLVPAAK